MQNRMCRYCQKASAYALTIVCFMLVSCTVPDIDSEEPIVINELRFIGEQILPPVRYENTTVGGLSGIDYVNGSYFMISDDRGDREYPRIYEAELVFDQESFKGVQITGVTGLKKSAAQGQATPFSTGTIDPEGLRASPTRGNFIWISEGDIKKGIDPAVFEMNAEGKTIRKFSLPKLFQANQSGEFGPRNNATLEGISLNYRRDGVWIAMEGPLKQDGKEPSIKETQSPVRISLFNYESGEVEYQFAYELDSVAPRKGAEGQLQVNGVVDVLAYADEKLLVMERSYVGGQADGGNDIKIYDVDISQATNVMSFPKLAGNDYREAKKTLLLDLNEIRHKASKINDEHVIDNLEGMTFGKRLSNGHLSLVIVADNNFNAFGQQLNQILVFEVR